MKAITIFGKVVLSIAVFLPLGLLAQEDKTISKTNLLIDEDERIQRLNIQGFMDFQYMQYEFKSEDSLLKNFFMKNGAFCLNNLNLYFSFNVGDDLLAFSEMRFLFAPSGIEQSTPVDDGYVYIGEDSSAVDYIIITPYNNLTSDSQATRFKYGSIFIERAYFEWNAIPYLNIRLGRYLVPYGIWSQDHGAPVLTSVRLPLLVQTPSQNVGMPQWQTGIELLGKVNVPGTSIFVDYAAYAGNGISDSDAIDDEADKNKAFGGFLNFKLPLIAKMIDIEFGCSGYQGDRTYIYKKTAIPYILFSLNDGTQSISYDIDYSGYRFYNNQLDTIAMSHIKISVGSLPLDGTLVLQSECIQNWVDEDDTRLVDRWGMEKDPEDYIYYGYYLQMEYQILGKITPYFRYEWYKTDSEIISIVLSVNHIRMYTMGLNIKPYRDVVIKTEWVRFDMQSRGGWFRLNTDGTYTPFDVDDDIDEYCIAVSFSF